MAINLPGPYEIEIQYLVSSFSHFMRLNVIATDNPAPGADFAAINLQARGGGTRTAEQFVTDFWAFMRVFYPTAVTVSAVNLWRYVPGTFEKTFISAKSSATATGSSGSASVLAQQVTQTYRSANGGIMMITRLESTLTNPGTFTLVPGAGAGDPQLAAFILSANNCAIARDDGFPIAAYRLLAGQNEAVFKKRYRPA